VADVAVAAAAADDDVGGDGAASTVARGWIGSTSAPAPAKY